MLAELDCGSLLIFGSTVRGRFLLDTVFVVGERQTSYPARDAVAQLGAITPASFLHAVAEPIQAAARSEAPQVPATCGGGGCISDRQYVLYEGATPESRVDGMFSFAPALRAPAVFDRPAVSVPDLNPDSYRNIRFVYPPSPARRRVGTRDHVRELWNRLVEQVVGAGLLLGARFEIDASIKSGS